MSVNFKLQVLFLFSDRPLYLHIQGPNQAYINGILYNYHHLLP